MDNLGDLEEYNQLEKNYQDEIKHITFLIEKCQEIGLDHNITPKLVGRLSYIRSIDTYGMIYSFIQGYLRDNQADIFTNETSNKIRLFAQETNRSLDNDYDGVVCDWVLAEYGEKMEGMIH